MIGDVEAVVVHDSRLQLALHSARGDATNTLVWQRSKLHSLEVCSGYLNCDLTRLVDSDHIQDIFVRDKNLADIMIVRDSSAPGTHGMILKQLKSLGCPSWIREQHAADAATYPEIVVFAYCADGGSDQAKVKQIMRVQAADDPRMLVIAVDCCFHAAQLVVKSSLHIVDGILLAAGRNYTFFFSTLAKLINFWRENARVIYQSWTKTHGAVSSYDSARKVPPKCIAGRWGSVFKTASTLGQLVWEELIKVFEPILTKKSSSENPEDIDVPDHDLRIEVQEAHRRRMGRPLRRLNPSVGY